MEKLNFSVEELSELEALEIRGGASSGDEPTPSQIECSNTDIGCGAGVTQLRCSNSVTGCGSIVHVGCEIVVQPPIITHSGC